MGEMREPQNGPGRIAGRYKIIRLLGSGAFGKALLAQDDVLDRLVVLKSVGPADDRAQALLLRESRILGSLRHSGLAATFGVVVDQGVIFLVTEFVPGQSLDVIQSADRLADDAFFSIYIGIARALAYLHGHGVVHRDLKPQNVIVSEDGTPTIIDFGLAVALREPDTLTGRGSVVGTPAYMTPEAVHGLGTVGPKSDVYSLGVMMWEVVTGERLEPRSFMELLGPRSEGVMAPGYQEKLPRSELGKLIERMLSPDPGWRPTAEEVATRLEAIRHRPGRAFRPAASVPVPARLVRARRGMNLVRALARWWPLLALAAGVALVLALVLLAKPRAGAHLLVAFVTGVAAILLGRLTAALARRKRARASEVEGGVQRRVAAIERRLQGVDKASHSVALSVGSLRSELSAAGLKDLIRESVALALQEVEAGSSTSDLNRALQIIAELTAKPGSDPWYKKVGAVLTALGAVVTLATGIVGIAIATKLWIPNGAPRVVSVSSPTARATRSRPLEVQVAAEDPDGDALTYSYESTVGTIEGQGPLAVWHLPSSLDVDVVTVKVMVSDGRRTSVSSRSFRVNRPPAASLDLPAQGTCGEWVRMAVNGTDPDGDALEFAWQASAGNLSDRRSAVVFLALPPESQRVLVNCAVSDGFESVQLGGQVDARGAGRRLESPRGR